MTLVLGRWTDSSFALTGWGWLALLTTLSFLSDIGRKS